MSEMTPNLDREIPTRRMSFDAAFAQVPRHFAVDGDLLLSHVAASLSAVFPDGEDFFVRSVRRFRDVVTDEALRRQVNGFIGQEAMHGRAHRGFNDRLHALGYPTKWFERMIKGGLAFRERVLPPIHNLAATAALEHYTATLAELLLTSEETRALFGNEDVLHLFLWHALEESEHKAVAFDVYKTAGGSERVRVFTMNVVTVGFFAQMTFQMIVSVLGDPATYRAGNLARSWRRFWQSPLMQREIWDRLREYNCVDFHPSHRDTTALIERWRAELFAPDGALIDKLAVA
jgi:predicted metal-dependent hydrolase